MNSYTNEEINLLLSEFPRLRNNILVGSTGYIVENSLFMSSVLLDPALDPTEILPFYSDIDIGIKKELSIIRDLIYYVPIHQVPLYINICPNIASWRLKIGK